MKNLIFTIVSILFFHSFSGQTITLNNINSSNILEYYQQNEVINQPQIENGNILTQIGNGNFIDARDINQNYLNILQYGNLNTTLFVNPNNYPTNAEIKINGSRNYIDITGSNSISDGMKLNINANDMTIFMRNY